MKEKILVFTKNWFGDVIMQTPCFKILKENFPQSSIHAAIPDMTRWILKSNPYIDGTISLDEREETRSPAAKLKFVMRIKEQRFTRAYLLHRSRTRAFLSFAAGIPIRVGYASKGRGYFLTVPVSEPKEPMHQSDYFVELLRQSGLNVPEKFYSEFHFSDQDRFRAEELWNQIIPSEIKRVVVLNPGANWEPKRWPAEYFGELADILAEDERMAFVITGAEKDKPLAEKIIQSAKKARVQNLCGRTSLGELGAFLSQVDLVVTADSGPMHIASSVGAPVVALFGPTDSGNTGPRGNGPVLIMQENRNGHDGSSQQSPEELMRSIQPETVTKAVKDLGWI